MRRIRRQVDIFCDTCSLHGFKYLSNKQLTYCERAFWFGVIITAIFFAFLGIREILNKWSATPVLISVHPIDLDLYVFPFPAVTICNMNQAKKHVAAEILQNGTDSEKSLLNMYCNGGRSDQKRNNQTVRPSTTSEIHNFLLNTSPRCKDMLKSCLWRGKKINCLDFFVDDFTDEGICCIFNRLPPDKIYRNPGNNSYFNKSKLIYDWTPEIDYPDNNYLALNVIPLRPSAFPGTHSGLTVVLDVQKDDYYCSSSSSYGFKATLANPTESPNIENFGFLINPGMETQFVIQPDIRSVYPTIRKVAFDKRQCYFQNERKLRFYRVYTQKNCYLECRSNYTAALCGCVPYYLPKDANIRECDRSDDLCVFEAKQATEVFYGNGDNYAVVDFIFTQRFFKRTYKKESFDFIDVISNVGGLLSLCIGFGVLSLVEIVYFITLRVLCFYLKSHRNTFPYLN